MLYLIGLGLNENSISVGALQAVKKCKEVYLENYTVDFPYSISGLEKNIGKKIIEMNREKVENEELVLLAKNKDIALLIYGDVLSATTHISLILRCEKEKVKYKIFHNASIFTAIAETGMQLYKFGKTSSIAKHDSDFMKYVKENQKINAHSLILVDIGLGFEDAILRLKEIDDKIVVCSCLGTAKQKIIYGSLNQLKKIKINSPYVFIIPSSLHFIEEEALKRFEI